MSQPAAIVRVTLRTDGQIQIERCDGGTTVTSAAGAGDALLEILRDPNLPQMDTSSGATHELASQVIKLLVPQELHPAAAAGAPMLVHLAQTWARNIKHRPKNRASAPPRAERDNEPTRRSAWRHGKRIA